ncbi:MAG: hypothetical protein HOW73_23770 [Polyangiaceae bacterium]|nr:hypothetical protein [Polyangiaceae bacterium]
MPTAALSIDVPSGPLKWTDFGGPIVKPELKAGDRAWAVVPVSAGWDTLKFSLLTVDRVEGDDAVFSSAADKRAIFVPGAFVSAAKPAQGLAKGDTVAVAEKDSRAIARVTSVDGGKVKVRFRYAGDIQELELDPSEVVKLDGTLKFGAPAGFSDTRDQPGGQPKTEWHPAYFVQTAEDKTWVVTTTGKPHRLAASNVKPLGIHVAHKAGDKVWVANGELLVEGQVTAIEDDGLRYKVKVGTEETSLPFESVSTPVK